MLQGSEGQRGRKPRLIEADREALDDPLRRCALPQPCAEAATAAAPVRSDPQRPRTIRQTGAEVDDLGRLVILQDARDLCGGLGIEVVRLAQQVPRQLFR